ncbi:flagellar hook-length control protein FliK [Sapientia aquatica]|uniref:Flagellar hook-length control protein FliK n=1 Tax=Sapientia aquatica TaxID=1549640 RepID=A0A4R5W5E4_9BURK|nr:flagellar hook-length control protein FliK [Sapientia aquatica]TDK68342.1 flagellar hook-length control protein FliK [Sapientia aquatica]
MVSGIDTPTVQNTLVEASTAAALVNQSRQGAIVNSSQLVVGKQFQAEVVSALNDGTYIVKVADVAARMQLPNSPQVGDKLALTLISTSPRATFLLGSANPENPNETTATPTTTQATLGTVKQLIDDFAASNSSSAPVGAGNLYLQSGGRVGTVGSDETSNPRLINITTNPPDSTPTTFSSAGKLVNDLLQNSQQQATASVSKVPLIVTPQVSGDKLASALESNVSTSGVFYESHLLQWAEGKFGLSDLLKEPQASFTTPATNPNTTASANQTTSANPEAAANQTPTNNLANTATQAGLNTATGPERVTNNPAQALASNAHGAVASSASTEINLPKEAAGIIQQQLQTMEQKRFLWHGELWAGQPMDWEISQDKPAQHQSAAESTWNSSVRFEFAQLGTVSAQLQLTGKHLRVTINTNNASSSVMLQNAAPELTNALKGTGAELDSLLIRKKSDDAKDSGGSS